MVPPDHHSLENPLQAGAFADALFQVKVDVRGEPSNADTSPTVTLRWRWSPLRNTRPEF
jgi:hypothetical protein